VRPRALRPPPDRPGGSHAAQHAGVLVPWANSVVEGELPRWAGTSVVWHYARLVPPSRGTSLDEGFLAGLLAAVPAALAQLEALPLERVYLACTSAAFMLPGDARAATARASVPVITAFDAILAVLRESHAVRIVLLTPYPAEVCDREAEMFREQGLTVTGHAALDLSDGYATIEPGRIEAMTRKVGGQAIEDAQAVVLSCTGWPTWGLADTLAKELGRQILSSNLAIATHALQASTGDGDAGLC